MRSFSWRHASSSTAICLCCSASCRVCATTACRAASTSSRRASSSVLRLKVFCLCHAQKLQLLLMLCFGFFARSRSCGQADVAVAFRRLASVSTRSCSNFVVVLLSRSLSARGVAFPVARRCAIPSVSLANFLGNLQFRF